MLGRALVAQGKNEEALPLLTEGNRALKLYTGRISKELRNNRLAQAAESLSQLAKEQNRLEDTEKWQAKLDELHGNSSDQ